MSVTPDKDPNYIYAHPYATLIADEYRMRGGYCIVRPGGTDDHLMLLTRAGRGLFRTPRGDAVPLAAGSLAVIPPGVPHDYGTDPAVGKWHFLWVHVHAPKDWQPFLGIPFGSGRLTVFARGAHGLAPDAFGRIQSLFRDVVAHTRRGTALDRAFAMNALENICLRLCAAIRREDTRPDAFIDTVNAFIREHLSERLTIARLAAATGALSPSRFAHTFTAAFGVSPQAYVESCRLEYAKRLLETTNASVKEASYAAGFADPLYFSRRFRRAYGLPPREIAKRPPTKARRGL